MEARDEGSGAEANALRAVRAFMERFNARDLEVHATLFELGGDPAVSGPDVQ